MTLADPFRSRGDAGHTAASRPYGQCSAAVEECLTGASTIVSHLGYFLDALADPAHENYAEMKDWIGESFDPSAVDIEGLADDVAALAKV